MVFWVLRILPNNVFFFSGSCSYASESKTTVHNNNNNVCITASSSNKSNSSSNQGPNAKLSNGNNNSNSNNSNSYQGFNVGLSNNNSNNSNNSNRSSTLTGVKSPVVFKPSKFVPGTMLLMNRRWKRTLWILEEHLSLEMLNITKHVPLIVDHQAEILSVIRILIWPDPDLVESWSCGVLFWQDPDLAGSCSDRILI